MFLSSQAQYSVTPTKRCGDGSGNGGGSRSAVMSGLRGHAPHTPGAGGFLPELLRDVKRRSLRVKRVKSANDRANRKSDSFVNLQDCHLKRHQALDEAELRLGVVGPSNERLAFVASFTGMEREARGLGRSIITKDVVLEGRKYSLLIRQPMDDSCPSSSSRQIASWCDALIFVFNRDSEPGICQVNRLVEEMQRFRSLKDLPTFVVGIQGHDEQNVDSCRVEALLNQLGNTSSYHEVCPASAISHNVHVERVFMEACKKVVMKRNRLLWGQNEPLRPFQPSPMFRFAYQTPPSSSSSAAAFRRQSTCFSADSRGMNKPSSTFLAPTRTDRSFLAENKENNAGFQTPNSTPNLIRKGRQRSKLFSTPMKKFGHDDKTISSTSVTPQRQVGSGRSIPLRQGFLYKKSNKSFSKEWKKKYVTLCDGKMTYHPSLQDYMTNSNGKEISLQYVTVKVPGQQPRGSRVVHSVSSNLDAAPTPDQSPTPSTTADTSVAPDPPGPDPSRGYRLRRMRSNGVRSHHHESEELPQPTFEFQIVSLENRHWIFETLTAEDRDDWVAIIEKQILSSLQGIASDKEKKNCGSSTLDSDTLTRIKSKVAGNSQCVDCDEPDPNWASINLGVLMCIECSGIHRQLGSHISRVRSLDLDDWPSSHSQVLLAIGNSVANSVWEASDVAKEAKPKPKSSHQDKEQYIFSKYQKKDFVLSVSDPKSLLLEGIQSQDMTKIIQALPFMTPTDLNSHQSTGQTLMGVATQTQNTALVQLLIWANADVNLVDKHGKKCISYANSQDLVTLLKEHGARAEEESARAQIPVASQP